MATMAHHRPIELVSMFLFHIELALDPLLCPYNIHYPNHCLDEVAPDAEANATEGAQRR